MDVISLLYGHACGSVDKWPARCEVGGGANTGVCIHGTKQRSYLLDKFRLGEGGSLARLKEFRGWMMSTMMQALYLQAVCLPIEANTCPSEIDPVSDANMKMSVNAINETIEIFQNPLKSAEIR